LSDGLREWFRELHLRPATAYAQFADEVIQPDNVIITFNYDDSLERELRRRGLWDVSQGYGFPLGKSEQPSPVLVLKLHGSINWLALIFGGVISGPMAIGSNLSIGQHPVIHKADLEFLGYTDFSGHVYPGGGAFRRGVATELHRAGVQDIVIQRALRHANVSVTQESYIQSVPEVVSDALDKLAKTRAVQRMGNA
jgi:hypothetical protein